MFQEKFQYKGDVDNGNAKKAQEKKKRKNE